MDPVPQTMIFCKTSFCIGPAGKSESRRSEKLWNMMKMRALWHKKACPQTEPIKNPMSIDFWSIWGVQNRAQICNNSLKKRFGKRGRNIIKNVEFRTPPLGRGRHEGPRPGMEFQPHGLLKTAISRGRGRKNEGFADPCFRYPQWKHD